MSHTSRILTKKLYCKHEGNKNKYFYHFSDEITHNFAFIYSIVKHLIDLEPE